MKKLSLNEIETISASGRGQTFISAVTCGFGLATLEFGIGGVLAVAGCGTLIGGNW